MTWVRLESGFTTHPKVAKVGPLGGWLFIEGLCYVADHGTDGFIPLEAVPRLLTALTGVAVVEDSRRKGKLRRTKPAELVDWPARLVTAGLWESAAGGYRVHNYLMRNPSREYFDHLTETRREAGRKGGLAKALALASRLPERAASKASKTLARYDTTRDEEKLLSFSGSNDHLRPAEPSPETASNEPTLPPEQVKRDVAKLVHGVLRPKP